MREKIEIIFENERIKVEKIQSFGCASPEGFIYDQSEDEFVTLIKGSAKLLIRGREIELNQGGHIYIKAHTPHIVKSVSNDAEWLCVYIKS
ncbi:MAG: cupin domain-containing protein [Christensenellales bacterium]|jgi:cupin 2 domain-containing protein